MFRLFVLLAALSSLACEGILVDADERAVVGRDCEGFRSKLPQIWNEKVLPQIMPLLKDFEYSLNQDAYTQELNHWLVLPAFSQFVEGDEALNSDVLRQGGAHVEVAAFRVSRMGQLDTLDGNGIRDIDYNVNCERAVTKQFYLRPTVDVITFTDAGSVLGSYGGYLTLKPNIPMRFELNPFFEADGKSQMGIIIEADFVPLASDASIDALYQGAIGDSAYIKTFLTELKKINVSFRKGHNNIVDRDGRVYCEISVHDEFGAVKRGCDAVMDAAMETGLPDILGAFVMLSEEVRQSITQKLKYRVFLDPFKIEKML